ncbi:uncharacterized protein LOC132716821 [Ruditapes philippinarum]|uniref:uncharacterized protein LOC132716821 n=1 Tax=Ruditapes philippinarum TaxID=129788 RepID=UPI00295AAE74|nr:uncharacterized protein LOC132716821 [Ruditapes philippinarum]XP_060556142.1 uncharacterized protein LOC132716821 [Ruditapes philippinarum]XP_060556143.1 uncharacterized protein LOC132716821 [Ruditapes philippinarum]XP_060556144.1 uncharacterized protein LOC132716821 [Ruditapes philippinarum]
MALSKQLCRREQGFSYPVADDQRSDSFSEVFDEISFCVRPEEDREIISNHLHDDTDDSSSAKPTVSCAKCVEHVRVERVSQIRRGHHITMPGKTVGNKYDSERRKQKWIYMHHAIVKDIIAKDDRRSIVELKLIHMWENERGELGLCETETQFALANDELYIVEYKHPRFTREQVVERAEKALNDRENARSESRFIRFSCYNVVTTNCEHFATWCVVGLQKSHRDLYFWQQIGQKIVAIGESSQVMEMKTRLVEIFGSASKIVKCLKVLFDSSDEITKILGNSMPSATTILSVTAAIYVLYCIIMTIYFNYKYARSEICGSCFRNSIMDLWARCSLYGITSIATFFILSNGVSIPAVVGCFALIALSVVCQHYIPNIRKALMAPYGCSKTAIYRLDDINIGDIVTIHYWGLPHDVIVTEVHTNSRDKKGKIRVVHYALDKLFSTKEVKEEYFTFRSVKKSFPLLRRHECGHLNLFPPEIAVLRAKQRIGERKWHWTKNRSDHVCYWAKVKQYLTADEAGDTSHGPSASLEGQGQSKHPSTLFMGEMEAHLSSDIEIGDAVRVKGVEGILVYKDCGERKMKLEIITVKDSVKKVRQFVNLNTDNVTVLRYHPVHCHPKPVRVDRARLIRGQKIPLKNFMDFCLLLNS